MPQNTGKSWTLGGLLGAAGNLEQRITGITNDSRTVQPGDLFAALPGSAVDGRDFIAQALENGAAAILSTPCAQKAAGGAPFIGVTDPRQLYAELCSQIAGEQPSVQIAVTGTNGKTSTADFVRQLYAALGYEAASFGTLGFRSGVMARPGGLTTPDPRVLHVDLAEACAKGVTHLAIEASSHGIDQRRLDGMQLSAAAFTNLTRDHLDYHGTFEAYYHSKARLFFDLLPRNGVGVINIDDPYGARLAELLTGLGQTLIRFGRTTGADLRLENHELKPSGQSFDLVWQGQTYSVDLPLLGSFQAENVSLAIGILIGLGEKPEAVTNAASNLAGVTGRMEFCGRTRAGGSVFVDYAHTPDGLKTVLASARGHDPAALSVVFGCGGDRDVGKRAEMGAIAAEAADRVYVTDDNPRSEDPAKIREAILSAAPGALEVGDRKRAIEQAIDDLREGDTLVVAGKGHEEGQIIGDKTLPFSDIECVAACLSGSSGGEQVDGVRGA